MELRPRDKPITSTRFVWYTHADRDAALRGIAVDAGMKPALRIFTSEILARYGVPERNDLAKAEALRKWFRANVPYQLEAGEQIVRPELTLSRPELGYDCDDQSLALAAMMVSVGAAKNTRFNYWSSRPSGEPEHVSVGVRTNNGVWVNVDPIYDHRAGWEPAGHYKTPGAPISSARAGLGGAGDVMGLCPSPVWPAIIGAIAAVALILTLRRNR